MRDVLTVSRTNTEPPTRLRGTRSSKLRAFRCFQHRRWRAYSGSNTRLGGRKKIGCAFCENGLCLSADLKSDLRPLNGYLRPLNAYLRPLKSTSKTTTFCCAFSRKKNGCAFFVLVCVCWAAGRVPISRLLGGRSGLCSCFFVLSNGCVRSYVLCLSLLLVQIVVQRCYFVVRACVWFYYVSLTFALRATCKASQTHHCHACGDLEQRGHGPWTKLATYSRGKPMWR